MSLLTMKNWRVFELVWLATFSVVAIIITVLSHDTLFGFSVFFTGIICVVLAAKGHIATYLFGMYNTLGYAYLSWVNHLNGEMALNLCFFVPMNVVGYFMWKNRLDGVIVQMRGLPVKILLLVIAVCAIGSAGLGFSLAQIPAQNTPYIDAITVTLSIIATILMVLRYKEQWLVYIVLNIFTVIVWIFRYLDHAENSALMIVMWTAFLINAVYGYYNWRRGASQ